MNRRSNEEPETRRDLIIEIVLTVLLFAFAAAIAWPVHVVSGSSGL